MISQEQNITFLWNKKKINQCLRWHILTTYYFVAEVTFKYFIDCMYLGKIFDWRFKNNIANIRFNTHQIRWVKPNGFRFMFSLFFGGRIVRLLIYTLQAFIKITMIYIYIYVCVCVCVYIYIIYIYMYILYIYYMYINKKTQNLLKRQIFIFFSEALTHWLSFWNEEKYLWF